MMQAQDTAVPHPSLSRYLCESWDLTESTPPAGSVEALENHIVVGDAIEVLAALPDNCVDLVHTSPPYNIDKPYESGLSDRSSIDDYVAFLRRAIGEIKRVVCPGGSIFWQTGYTQNGGESREIIPIDLLSYDIFRGEPCRFMLWDRIIWRYWGGHAFTKKFTNKHETIMWYVKPGAEPAFDADAVRERSKEYDKRNNFWGRNPGNVWEVDRVAFGATEQTSHIAVFPEEITERIVRACSKPGDLVLDPFSGSGTVPKVARSLERRWLGIEISPVYASESAIRVGFQQSGEMDSLASELIKYLVFHSVRGRVELPEIEKRLALWAGQVNVEDAREAFEDDIELVFTDGSGRNSTKPRVWNKYDDLLSSSVAAKTAPVVLADRLLLNCYKLRRHFNGVRRYVSALDALEGILTRMRNIPIADYIRQIAAQEPSAFRVTDDYMELYSPQRTVSSYDQETSRQTEEYGEVTEVPQRRLLL